MQTSFQFASCDAEVPSGSAQPEWTSLLDKIVEVLSKNKAEPLPEHEAEGLTAALECIKHGSVVCLEVFAWQRLSPAEQTESKFGALVRLWVRYRRASDGLLNAPTTSLVSSRTNLQDFIGRHAQDIFGPWNGFRVALLQKLERGSEEMKKMMEVGSAWKSSIGEEEDMEKINGMADQTLMQVKGKKLTMEREAMAKA